MFHQHLFSSHFPGLVVSSSEPLSLPPTALVVIALGHRGWLSDMVLSGLACLGVGSKIDITKGGDGSRKWRPIDTTRGLVFGFLLSDPWGWDLLDLPWLVRSTNDEEFEYFYLWIFIPQLDVFVEIKIRHQPEHLSFPNNNQFGSGIKRALGPNQLGESSSFLYPWIEGGYYGQ